MLELIDLDKNSGYYKYKVRQVKCLKGLIDWGRTNSYFVELNSHRYYENNPSLYAYHKYENITAWALDEQKACFSLSDLESLLKEDKAWYFGYFSYDIKNQIHSLKSIEKKDLLDFNSLFFFKADMLVYEKDHQWFLESLHSVNNHFMHEVCHYLFNDDEDNKEPFLVQQRISKEAYIRDIERIKCHIQQGDIYELNYCQEFFMSKVKKLNTWHTYKQLCKISPTPFAAFLKQKDKYVMSASPERYLCKRGNKVFSQPIKGTIKMGDNEVKNQRLKETLREDIKEQSENVMIVDLVRNDLSRTAQKGSVQVDELMGIYPFKNLYQMISTVSSELKPHVSLKDLIETSFPMGSMTGAPKIRAMQLAESFEAMKRGLYSGAVGYIDPDNDFDFNVIIRSLLYNASNEYLSFCVGSAITIQANAEKEYEECLLKAEAIMKYLTQNRQ